MKTIRKTTKTLNFQKFQIAKLNNLSSIMGGRAVTKNSSEGEEENEEIPTTTDETFPTTTHTTTNTVGG